MIWIYPEQLSTTLKQSIKSIYVLIGNNLCALQNSQEDIIKITNNSFNIKNFNFKLNNYHFNWDDIFNLCKTIPLFKQRNILSLDVFLNYPVVLLNKNIPLLYPLLHNSLIIILLIHTSPQSQQQHKTWMKLLHNDSAIFVNCTTTNYTELINWIRNRSKNMNLTIDDTASQLLCHYYEGNHILLNQTLQYLSLVYPDGNLSYLRIKKTITDSALFNSNHWIEAVLLGNKNRANRILKKIIHHNPLKLLYKIQLEIMILIQIKYSIMKKEFTHTLFNKNKIYLHHKRSILLRSAHRLNFNQLNQAISLLIQMELTFYQNETTALSKFNFELLTEILCDKRKNFAKDNIITNNII